MKLNQLLSAWISGLTSEFEITGLSNHSRTIQAGDLFFAYPGAQVDGRDFIVDALRAGAGAVLYEASDYQLPDSLPQDALIFPLFHLEAQLAKIASHFHGDPSQFLAFTGVTGTNGKTTIAYQLAQAHDLLKIPAAYIGTLGEGQCFSLNPLHNTTPDALILQACFAHYLDQGIQQVCMEVSSHALSQHRVDHIPFQQAIFTNLTLDHLDYHKTMEAYAEAKALLFKTNTLRYAILNQDDSASELMRASCSPDCAIVTYGIHENADVQAKAWEVNLKGTVITIHSPWGDCTLRIQALGFFNLYNALAIFSSLMLAGYPLARVLEIMSQLKPAPGRMQVVATSPTVIVDYAHTPDALKNVLATLQEVKQGRIIVVFGCGGDRDRSKRPVMGKIASDYADLLILTSDNPRHEEPNKILDDIVQGIPADRLYERIADRQGAIERALAEAQSDDIVLIAGKGHETYQQLGDHRIPFSDQAVVESIIS